MTLNLNDADAFQAYLSQLSRKDQEDLFASLGNYDETPLEIEDFLDHPEYLGNFFQGKLYPYWRHQLKTIYPSPFQSPYWLVSFRGSIGQGKTTAACAAVAYDLHRLLCMTTPQKSFDLVPSTRILFAIFNATLGLASDVVWGGLSQMFAVSPYFSRFMAKLRSKKRGGSLFAKNVDFFLGSRLSHTLGKAVYEAIIDEANFGMVDGQVYDTFNGILSRMESRFMTTGGGIPGKIFVVSSESDKFAVVNQIVDGYHDKEGVFISQPALWEVLPHRYGPRRFWVFTGTDVKAPEVLELDSPVVKAEPEHCIQVPEEHRDRFEADIHESLRALAGISTGTSYKLFRLRDRLTAAFAVSPLFPDRIQVDFDDDFDQIANHLKVKTYFASPLHKHMPRHVHIDIGVSGDRLGIAAAYVAGFRQRVSHDVATFQQITEDVPDIVGEWAVGIEPKPGKRVPLYKVRVFLEWLAKQGYPIAGVTCDGFQSEDMIQLLTKKGFEASVFSMDRTSLPYIMFRNTVYEGRAQLPNSPLLKREAEELDVTPDGLKVDHPKKNRDGSNGSKDVADAMGAAVHLTEKNAHKYKLISGLAKHAPQLAATVNLKNTFWPAGG